MYTLQFVDGSSLSNLRRINPSTFTIDSTNPDIYWRLTDYNLSFATLLHDDELDDVFIDYTLQNFCVQGGTTRFRVVPLNTLEKGGKRR